MSNLDDELMSVLNSIDDDITQAKKGGKKKPKHKRDDIKHTVALGDGELAFTEVFGVKPPSGIDHAVRVFMPGDWHESVRCFIPKVDNTYVFPPSETEAAVVAVMSNDRGLTIGPKGSGKTTLWQQICARMCIPWMRVNCRLDMESSMFFGTPSLGGGSLGWVDGPLPLLGKHGGMLTCDEISATPAGIAMALMSPLEPNGVIFVADKPVDTDRYITPHPWFRITATDNTALQGDTTGRYAGTNVQNEALIDRFSTAVRLNYLSKEHEKAVIHSHVPNIPDDWCDHMLEVANIVRRAYDQGNMNFTMSPRGLVNWAKKVMYWGDLAKSFQLAFGNKLTEDDHKQMVEIFNKVTSIDLNKVV